MVFKATTGSLQQALLQAQNETRRLKQYAESVSSFIASNNVSANQIIEMLSEFKSYRETFLKLKSTPNMVNYAKEQFDDVNYDIITEFQTMNQLLNVAMVWIINNFPKDANGYILKDKFESDGGIAVRSFTPLQLTPLKSLIDNLIGSIE